MNRHFLSYIIGVCFAIWIVVISCAKQGFPPGGPVDKRPPFIVETNPKSDSTNVPLNTKIEIVFSEVVDQRSVEESIFITPFPGSGTKYKWSGKRLRLQLPEELRPNRTYVITIGTTTKDRRNNLMKESFSLAFSTGSILDQGRIEGGVYGEGRVEGTQIWAYDLKDTPEPNPSTVEPVYITQAGATGDYRFSYLAFSEYRLFAMVDRDANGRYDPEYDALGVSAKDVALSENAPKVAPINFRIAVRDTTPPRLEAAAAPDRNHVDLRFSERLAPDFLSDTTNYLITGGTDTLWILDAVHDERNSSYVHLTTAAQAAAKEYHVLVKRAVDLVGFPIDSVRNDTTFSGHPAPDTLRPRFLSMIPADSSFLVPLSSAIELLFSEAMQRAALERSFTLGDTLGHTVSGRFGWKNSAHVIFAPDKELAAKTFYRVTMPVDSVFDLIGNKLADTLFVKRFTTIDPDTLSEISGQIIDQDSTASGAFLLTAKPTSGNSHELWIAGPGAYRFERILPGIYTIQIFRDADGNKQYSLGEAFPFKPAERYYVYPDSIHVRSRWPNEGNDIIFPK